MTKPVRFGRLGILWLCLLLGLSGCQALHRIGNYPEQEKPKAESAPAAETEAAPEPAPARPTAASRPATEPEPPRYSMAQARAALSAAGVKPLDAGGLAYYMDVQEAKLRQQLGNAGVEVQRDEDKIRLTLQVAQVFEPHSTRVAAHYYDRLNTIALVLKEYGRTVVRLDGYTDSSGGSALNRRLSRRRAQAVADYLVRQGINRQRLVVHGYGESSPVADNSTAAGRARNRRVELILIPLVAG